LCKEIEMTNEEYDIKMKNIEKEFNEKKKALVLEYVNSNAIAKKGDIIEDKRYKICVRRLCCSIGFKRYPIAWYEGVKLTKKNEPYKSQEVTTIMQADIININDKPIK